MQIGDRVAIRFPDGTEEDGTIADLDAATARIGRAGEDGRAIVVARRRLLPTGPNRWRLEV